MTLFKVPGLKQSVQTGSIVLVEGDGNYARLHFEDGQVYTAVRTLKWFEDQLTGFVRLHKHLLINPTYIAHFNQQTTKEAHVLLKNGTTYPIARRRIKAVKVVLDIPSNR